jgi:hypothetical protein
VKTLPKEERPSRKRKKEEYNKKRRERSGEIVKGRSSIYRKILRYYSTVHLQFYPYYYTYPYTYPLLEVQMKNAQVKEIKLPILLDSR